MSLLMRKLVEELPKDAVTVGQRLLLSVIADHADDNGRNAFPGLARLMAKTAMSRRYIQIALKKLVADGWLVRVRLAANRRVIYHLTLKRGLPGRAQRVRKPRQFALPLAVENPVENTPVAEAGEGDPGSLQGDLGSLQGDLECTSPFIEPALSAAFATRSPLEGDLRSFSNGPEQKQELPALCAGSLTAPVENHETNGPVQAAVCDQQGGVHHVGAPFVGRLEIRSDGSGDGARVSVAGFGRDLEGARSGSARPDEAGPLARAAAAAEPVEPRTGTGPTPTQVADLKALKSRLFGGAS